MLDLITLGAQTLFTPANIGWLLAGVFIGLMAGATPGISGTMMVAILLPLTFGLNSTTALVLMTAIYATAVFSGSITAVLFRTPGAPEAAATVLDGYEMTRQGKPHQALGHAMFASFLGGTFGAIVFLAAAPQLARVALEFGSPEVFALIFFTMVAVATIGGGNRLKGLLCSFFGLFLATVGMDVITGTYRYTFNVPILAAGVSFIPAILGLFAVSEAIRMVQGSVTETRVVKKVKTIIPRLSEIKKLLPTYLRSGPLGLLIGALPGVGATTASFVSYATAARFSKHPEKFGTGIAEGIAAPETANNAAAMGAMIPMLSLGIPGSATTAVMLAAIILHGLRPGPFLFIRSPDFVGAIMLTAIIANVLIIAVSPIFIRLFTRIFQIPQGVLGTVIIILCVAGGFAMRNNMADVWMVFGFGVMGYVLERHKFPLAPIVIGLVLGQLFEQEFRRSLTIAHGDAMIFLTNPISAVIIGITILILVIPLFRGLWHILSPSKAR